MTEISVYLHEGIETFFNAPRKSISIGAPETTLAGSTHHGDCPETFRYRLR